MTKETLKTNLLRMVRSRGGFAMVSSSSLRRNSLLILCYHGLSLCDEHKWVGTLYMTADRFRERLQLLKSLDAHVLPLGEALDRLRKRSLPPRSAVLTFDDGFYDFSRHAVPVLTEFGYPCTLYLTTHYCGYQVPIFNLAVNYLLWKSGRTSIEWPGFGLDRAMPIRTYEERQEVVQLLGAWTVAEDLDTLEKDQVARQLAQLLSIDYDELVKSRIFQILTPEEVRETARAGIDIQLHTHRHRTPRNRDLFVREIRDNSARIHELTGVEPVHFCYPSGVYAPEFLGWLRELGVRSATTCEAGLAEADTEPLLLPRFLDHSHVDTLEFESWFSGLRAR